MKLIQLLALIYLFSNVYLLDKYGSEALDGIHSSIIFVSKDFEDNEEMHFKIRTDRNNFESGYNYVTYYYVGPNGEDTNSQYGLYVNYKKTEYDGDYETKFFTIKKKSIDYRPYDGNNMVLMFYLYRNIGTVTNTEEDEGKLETWVIVVIVVVVVAIIAGIIIYCICRRIRLAKAAQVNQARTAAVAVAANEMAAQQNAAYMAQQNAAYIAQQNYQAQQDAAYMAQQNYQGQPYQDPNYMAADAGYSSNAAVVAV